MKVELPVVTKEIHNKHLEEQFKIFLEDIIHDFFIKCKNCPFDKCHKRITIFKPKIDFFPECRHHWYIKHMVDNIIALGYEHNGQVNISEVQTSDTRYATIDGAYYPFYEINLTYTPSFKSEASS